MSLISDISRSLHPPVLRVIAQLDFLAQATGYFHGYTARAGAGVLSAHRVAGEGEVGGGGTGRRGLLATQLASAVVGTRSCPWLRPRRVSRSSEMGPGQRTEPKHWLLDLELAVFQTRKSITCSPGSQAFGLGLELHHQLSWVSSPLTADLGTSQHPQSCTVLLPA